LLQFNENPPKMLWMEEHDGLSMGTNLGNRVQRADPGIHDLLQRHLNVLHLGEREEEENDP